MDEIETLAPTDPLPSPPMFASSLVYYLIRTVTGFRESDAYAIDLDGDYREYVDMYTTALSAVGRFLMEMVDAAIDDPGQLPDLKPRIDRVFDVLEVLSKSDNPEIPNAVFTGTMETIDSAERSDTLATIVRNLRPTSRKLWDDWMPLNSTRDPHPERGVDL